MRRYLKNYLLFIIVAAVLCAYVSVFAWEPCDGDMDHDSDIDGVDLSLLISAGNFSNLLEFAGEFGKTSCQTGSGAYSFVVFGDLNGGGCERNDRVNRLVQHIQEREPDAAFYMSTGDIIDGYWNSNSQTACFATDPALIRPEADCGSDIPNGNMAQILSPLKDRPPFDGLSSSFYLALGNHDDNWGSGWYPDPCGQGICDFLAPLTPADFINHPFDADSICNLSQSESTYARNFYYSFTYNNTYFIVLKMNNDYLGMMACNQHPGYDNCQDYCSDPALVDDPARNNYCYNVAQYDWLVDELQQASSGTYDHIFVFAHAPLVTSSEDHPATGSHAQIRALLEQYNVDIFFNGHNHAYERTHPLTGDTIDTDDGVVYITAGSAGGASSTVIGDWFTAVDANDFTTYGEPDYADKMTTYLKITVNTDLVSGELVSLGLPDGPVDQFTLQQTPVDDNVPVIGDCQLFPEDNMWNTPIDDLPLHPNSDNYINSIGADETVHPDFGTQWQGMDIGIPYDIIPDSQPFVDVTFQYYEETDPLDVPGPVKSYPMPDSPSIEGGSDNHVILVRKGSCILYELYNVSQDQTGDWTAGSGAVWHLDQNEIRPEGFTSADAAGLAILPGLVRYKEVFGDPANGTKPGIHHALRITARMIQSGYIRPASHSDGRAGNDPDYPPMGLRLRLKPDFNIDSYDEPIKVILRAMKKYGVVIADTGSDMFLSGVHHDDWDDDLLRQLKTVKASDFEAVYTGPIIPY
ncbi:MAG: hypothetical protein GY729_22550 [Desulfobacteraceae bacterium]|nr:hypothetical protein [Desulfobacteraceae bacterium]